MSFTYSLNRPTAPRWYGSRQCNCGQCAYCFAFCSPPVENSKSAGGPVGADGLGVCTLTPEFVATRLVHKSNLDKGELRIVRKGATVDYMGLRARVVSLRLGIFSAKTLIKGEPLVLPCAWVRVVA